MDSILVIVTAHMHDTGIVPVALQHFSAKCEEGRTRKAIVLKDDDFRAVGENPVKPGGESTSAAQICFREVRKHIAWPIKRLQDHASCLALPGIVRSVGTGTICHHEQAGRLCGANALEDTRRQSWTVENKKCDRRHLIIRENVLACDPPSP